MIKHRDDVTQVMQETREAIRRIAGVLIFGCLFTTGCASVMRFAGNANSDCIFYESTRGDLGGINAIINPPPRGIEYSYVFVPNEVMWFFLPFLIVDLPIAIALDTVLLPYDAYRYCVDTEEDGQRAAAYLFWEKAFRTDTMIAEEAARFFTDSTLGQILLELSEGRGKTNVINAVFDLSMAQNKTNLLVALSSHGRISPDQWRALYAWQLARGDRQQIQYLLARNPASPFDMLTQFAASPDELLCWAVMDSGRLPLPMLRDALAKSPPDWLQNKLRLAADPAADPVCLMGLAMNKYYGGLGIQTAVAANPRTPTDGLRNLARSPFDEVRAAVAANPSTPEAVVIELLADKDAVVRAAAKVHLKSNTLRELELQTGR